MKILLAEDDDILRGILATMLAGLGHEVTATPDGQAAWDHYAAGHPDVVISDWNMPHMTGIDLCRAIRKGEVGRYSYFIMLTANTGEEEYREAMAAGVDDFLLKPFNEHALTVRLGVATRIMGYIAEIRRLEGMLSICSYCKKIRDDDGAWHEPEHYVRERTEVDFSHGICPACLDQRMAQIDGD